MCPTYPMRNWKSCLMGCIANRTLTQTKRKTNKQVEEPMFIALIHWRIKPDEESKAAFIQHWNTRNSISNRKGLIAEFVSDTLPMADFPYITWHLDV